MGRVLPCTGELEIIGRCDFMVKIRGYSVVLGAVESAVAKHPMLASAVAITEGAEGTDKRVVCYTWQGRLGATAKLLCSPYRKPMPLEGKQATDLRDTQGLATQESGD